MTQCVAFVEWHGIHNMSGLLNVLGKYLTIKGQPLTQTHPHLPSPYECWY